VVVAVVLVIGCPANGFVSVLPVAGLICALGTSAAAGVAVAGNAADVPVAVPVAGNIGDITYFHTR
jgi:TPP-dependent indolepyruvate ferredoxin oxidoreductase alpha subunit